DDSVSILRRQRPTQLHTRHDGYGGLQRWGATVMKIGGSQRHIPQTGDAEDFAIPWDLREEKAPQVDRSGGVMGGWRLLKDAEFLKYAAPDIDALVTRDTAVRFEDGVPPAFDGAQGLGLVPEVAIEAGVRRHQRALVCR